MPASTLSSGLLPEPLRPMIPSVSPARSSRLTPESTCSRSKLRRARRPKRCSRTVLRRTLGMTNVLWRSRARRTGGGIAVRSRSRLLQQLGGARTPAAEDRRARRQDDRRAGEQVEVAAQAGNGVLDEDGARELEHWRPRPEVEQAVEALGQDVEWVDDGRDEEARLQHHLPDLVEVAPAQEEDAGGEREADGDEQQAGGVEQEQREPGGARRAAGGEEEGVDDDREDQHGEQRVGRGCHHHYPRRQPCLAEQESLGVERGEADARALVEEVPEEETDDEVEAVVGLGGEDEREDAEQHEKHHQRLEQGPQAAAGGGGLAALKVGAAERLEELTVVIGRSGAAAALAGQFARRADGVGHGLSAGRGRAAAPAPAPSSASCARPE